MSRPPSPETLAKRGHESLVEDRRLRYSAVELYIDFLGALPDMQRIHPTVEGMLTEADKIRAYLEGGA